MQVLASTQDFVQLIKLFIRNMRVQLIKIIDHHTAVSQWFPSSVVWNLKALTYQNMMVPGCLTHRLASFLHGPMFTDLESIPRPGFDSVCPFLMGKNVEPFQIIRSLNTIHRPIQFSNLNTAMLLAKIIDLTSHMVPLSFHVLPCALTPVL